MSKSPDDMENPPKASAFGSAEPTDGRDRFEWDSRYDEKARKIFHTEALVLSAYFLGSLILIFLTWSGIIEHLLQCAGIRLTSSETFRQYCYITFSGLLGGSIFSIKWLIHSVARGLWHLDRQLWRYLTPLNSLGIAFIIGTLISANFLNSVSSVSSPVCVSIGFIAGYFSDNAIAKMYEIANVILGTASKSEK